jgi:hypothetical protein
MTKPKRKPSEVLGPFVLLGDNGTYYRGMTAIGPCFGGTVGNAKRFDSRHELALERAKHWAVSGETLTLAQANARERRAQL